MSETSPSSASPIPGSSVELDERIKALGYLPTPALVSRIMELHSASVPVAVIRRAWRDLDNKRKADEKALKEETKRARDAAKTAGAGSPAGPSGTH